MRYLLLSVLVVCVIGVIIPVNFASAWHVCDIPLLLAVFDTNDPKHSVFPEDRIEAKKFLQCFEQNPSIIHDNHPTYETYAGDFASQDVQGMILFNVARSYDMIGDTDNAIDYYHQVINDVWSQKRSVVMITAYTHLCYSYLETKEYSKALYFGKAVEDPHECRDAAEAGLESTKIERSFIPIEPLYIVIGVVVIGGVIGVIAIAKTGSKTPKPVKEEPKKKETSGFCENCGNSLKPTTKFCGKCGNQV